MTYKKGKAYIKILAVICWTKLDRCTNDLLTNKKVLQEKNLVICTYVALLGRAERVQSEYILSWSCYWYPVVRNHDTWWGHLAAPSDYDWALAKIVSIWAYRGIRGTLPATVLPADWPSGFLTGYCSLSFCPINLAFVPFDITSDKSQFIKLSNLSLQWFIYFKILSQKDFAPFVLRDPSKIR